MYDMDTTVCHIFVNIFEGCSVLIVRVRKLEEYLIVIVVGTLPNLKLLHNDIGILINLPWSFLHVEAEVLSMACQNQNIHRNKPLLTSGVELDLVLGTIVPCLFLPVSAMVEG